MQVKQHVRMGVVWGLGGMALGAQALGITWAADVLLVPAIVGGAAEWDDIDHHGSTVTRAFPPITYPLHWIVVWVHRIIYMLTRRGDDPPTWDGYYKAGPIRKRIASYLPHGLRWMVGVKRRWIGAHRGISHSIFTAIIVGAFIGYMCAAGPWWVSVIVFVTTVGLAGELVFAGPVLGIYGLAGWLTFGAEGLAAHLVEMGWLWGLCVTVGMISHCFADTCTSAGLAFLSPFTWKEIYSPVPFDTGGFFEKVIVKWVLIVMMTYLGWVVFLQWIPSFPIAHDMLQALSEMIRSLINGVMRG